MSEKDPQVLVRMPSELKAELMARAVIGGRSLTSEINTRLRDSLNREVTETASAISQVLNEGSPKYINRTPDEAMRGVLSEARHTDTSALEEKLLRIFQRMPFEKQLALLSLLN